MGRFLLWVSGFMPCRIISDDGRPYLERYYLFTILGWRFYLHRFVGSDPARGLHDHPWRRAFSIVLSGWYWEETRSGTRRVRWFNSLTGDTFHRVVLPSSGFVRCLPPTHPECDTDAPCWTLFFHTVGDVKPWGFWVEGEPLEIDLGLDSVGALFCPYTYKSEGGKKSEWWKTAPKGRDVRS